MRKPAVLFFSSLTVLLQSASAQIFADATDAPLYQEEQQQATSQPQPPSAPFDSFTGKINKNKVRLRQQPNLDSPILKELTHGDMVIVIGETDDFYAVQPPADTKAYVYRTYVLDNVVEGSRVNVRLEPDTDSPIIAQLNAGTKVQGTVSPLNSKWLEITPPDSTRFYVAKEYIERIGDSSLMATMEKRREEVNRLLNSTYIVSQTEMQKSFPEINLDGVYANFNKIINDYQDFPEQSARARELITLIQDNYLQKKVSFLEAKSKAANDDWHTRNSQLNEQMKSQQQRLAQLEQQLQKEKAEKASRAAYLAQNTKNTPSGPNNKTSVWMPREQEVYQTWASRNNNRSKEEFYQEQNQQAVTIHGVIEPYTRAIKNKPGDYILVNQASRLPIAYMYSTEVDLHDYIGHEVSLRATPRPNNNFAFPAYFILSTE